MGSPLKMKIKNKTKNISQIFYHNLQKNLNHSYFYHFLYNFDQKNFKKTSIETFYSFNLIIKIIDLQL